MVLTNYFLKFYFDRIQTYLWNQWTKDLKVFFSLKNQFNKFFIGCLIILGDVVQHCMLPNVAGEYRLDKIDQKGQLKGIIYKYLQS